MDKRDDVTKEWFATGSVMVDVADELAGWLSDESLVRLSGAPKNSLVSAALIDNAIEIRVHNPRLLAEDMVRLVFQHSEQYRFLIRNAAFVLNPALRRLGIGTRSFAIEVTEAATLGLFDKITIDAIGSPETLHPDHPYNQYNGVYSWARLGFDADIPGYVRRHCTHGLSGYTKVHQLMNSVHGRQVWAEHACSLEMEFLLAAGSPSWALLLSYLLEKDIRVTP